MHALSKSFGDVHALRDLDLDVRPGEIFGFLGPNGAGKTTTIRLLLGLLRPTAVAAWILGFNAHTQGPRARRAVSCVPSEDALYDFMSVAAYLETVAPPGPSVQRRRAGLLERLDLDPDRRIKALSQGNRRKVALVAGLQADTPVYLLDEPTAALDPLIQQEFNRTMRDYRAEGRTVFMSTHVLSEAEALCDRVGILRAGSLVAVESVAELKRARVRRLVVRFVHPAPPDAAFRDARVARRNAHATRSRSRSQGPSTRRSRRSRSSTSRT